jgi:RNA polymerase sigma-70 factor (ECF subfamily)
MGSERALDEFEGQRSRLFGLAYRLLGSAEDAEDTVQDAFVRWEAADREAIIAPAAWLAKVTTNLCLNRLTSARALREQYVGPWLPEPVLTADGALGPMETVEQRDQVSLALLVLMERLTPVERAVFVLREAFAFSHREMAEILELSEANCRQLHRRARQRVQEGRPRFQPDASQRRRLVERFLAAARDGDVGGLKRLLAAEATSLADSGGRVSAARRPIVGGDRVARYLLGGFDRFAGDLDISLAEVNGEPALLGRAKGTLVGVLVPEFAGERLVALRIVANPDKLGFLARQLASLSHSGSFDGSSF